MKAQFTIQITFPEGLTIDSAKTLTGAMAKVLIDQFKEDKELDAEVTEVKVIEDEDKITLDK